VIPGDSLLSRVIPRGSFLLLGFRVRLSLSSRDLRQRFLSLIGINSLKWQQQPKNIGYKEISECFYVTTK